MTKTKEENAIQAASDIFGKNVGTEQLFSHAQLEELRGIVRACIKERVMALVSGPPGVGKTIGVRSVTDELPGHKYTVVYLGQDRNGTNLLRRFAVSLGLQPRAFRANVAMQISNWLLDNLGSGGKEVVLVVDEGHVLDDGTLEDFRLMTNADNDRQSPLTLILLGQSELRQRLRSPKFQALSQRLRYRYCLEGLDEDEASRYVLHRLSTAGAAPELFTQDALQYIFQACEGVPRRINNLCALSLLRASLKQRSSIDASFLKDVMELE
jgi:type II secretory pathway predicted ATPase ExeA